MPIPSEASIQWGLEYQKLVFVREALRMHSEERGEPGTIERVEICAPQCRGIDDVVLSYVSPGRRNSESEDNNYILKEFIQCKYHLNSSECVYGNVRLTELAQKTWWKTWQVKYNEWMAGRTTSDFAYPPFLVKLVTNSSWNEDELPLRHNRRIHDEKFFGPSNRDGCKIWRDGLNVSAAQEDSFRAFICALRIEQRLSFQDLKEQVKILCIANHLHSAGPNSLADPYLGIASKLLEIRERRWFSPESLTLFLRQERLIRNDIFPAPPSNPWRPPKFAQLRKTHKQLSDVAVRVCFMQALDEVFGVLGRRLRDVFPGLESRGFGWERLHNYFTKWESLCDQRIDPSDEINLFRFSDRFEQNLRCYNKTEKDEATSLAVLSLVFTPNSSRIGKKTMLTGYDLTAALQRPDGAVKCLVAPVGNQQMAAEVHGIVSAAVRSRGGAPKIEEHNLYFNGLIEAAQSEMSRGEILLIDLYLPFQLLSIDWGHVLMVSDSFGDEVSLRDSDYRYRVRSYNRWASRLSSFSNKQEALRRRWHFHSSWEKTGLTNRPLKAYVIGGRTDWLKEVKPGLKRLFDDDSFVAIVHASCIQSENIVESFFKEAVDAFVPLVAWWGQGLDGERIEKQNELIRRLQFYPLDSRWPESWDGSHCECKIEYQTKLANLDNFPHDRCGYLDELFVLYDSPLDFVSDPSVPELFLIAAGKPTEIVHDLGAGSARQGHQPAR